MSDDTDKLEQHKFGTDEKVIHKGTRAVRNKTLLSARIARLCGANTGLTTVADEKVNCLQCMEAMEAYESMFGGSNE